MCIFVPRIQKEQNMKTVIKEITPVIINGKEYLTLPQAITYTKMDKGVFRQRLNRDTIDQVIINPKYVFISMETCDKILHGETFEKRTAILKELFTVEELDELIKSKLPEKKNLKKK